MMMNSVFMFADRVVELCRNIQGNWLVRVSAMKEKTTDPQSSRTSQCVDCWLAVKLIQDGR
jgi:hypothetical protein